MRLLPRLGFAGLVCLAVFAHFSSDDINTENSQSANGDEGSRNSVKWHDTLTGSLPTAALETYRQMYPGHMIWQVTETRIQGSTIYDLVIFKPDAATSVGHQADKAHVQTIQNYHLVVDEAGKVLREDIHPTAESLVPKAAKDAFEQWRKPFPGRDLVIEWWAYQETGKQRLFRASVDVNALETYRAHLKSDGTIVKNETKFRP